MVGMCKGEKEHTLMLIKEGHQIGRGGDESRKEMERGENARRNTIILNSVILNTHHKGPWE